MEITRWSKAFEIGIPEFDTEHRALFEALSALRTALQTADHDRAQQILDEIGHHATDHFRHEEDAMRRAKYAGLVWHRQQHDTAKKRLGPLLHEARDGARGAGERLIAFLAEWLGAHIAVHDRIMAASIRNAERSKRPSRQRRAA